MKKPVSILVSAIFLSIICTKASGEVPQEINYQGKLTDPNGGLIVSDTVGIEFNIYDALTGGTSLWSETHDQVIITNGLFSVVLGSQTAIPYSVFDGDARYLGITVETDPEVTPRVPIVSVGHAFRAEYSDTADYARVGQPDDDWTIDGDNIYRQEGSVAIGTSAPSAKLDVQGTVKVGVDDTGYDANFYGAESGGRMFWDESKMALRAGKETGNGWDDVNVGGFSFGAGLGVMAAGHAAVAIGDCSYATGDHSCAIGDDAEATGQGSIALGSWAFAENTGAVAIGQSITAAGERSMVIGKGENDRNPLVNNISNSLMVGFNSTMPTLFVGENSVGIGTTTPDAKLTVKAGVDGMVLKGYSQSGEVIVEIGEGLDYSETFPTAEEDIAPGMVMVIDPVNTANLTVSTEPYDTKVAGIIAGANGLRSGVRLGSRYRDNVDHAVALAGRVYCYVDTKYGDIKPGDLLTTSPTPGHAMIVKDYPKAQGAILGKAMGRLSGGDKGQILVLVTLQ